jgi:antirestriction protein
MKNVATKHPATQSLITNQMAVYVGTYGKYNDGSIYGAWIDLTLIKDEEDFNDLCAEIHKDEQDPEFMLQDWQSIPSRYISESGLSAEFWDYLEAYNGTSNTEALKKFVDYGYSPENFSSYYMGEFDSEQEYAEALLDETGELEQIPQHLRYYFDYESYASDLFINDYLFIDGSVFQQH